MNSNIEEIDARIAQVESLATESFAYWTSQISYWHEARAKELKRLEEELNKPPPKKWGGEAVNDGRRTLKGDQVREIRKRGKSRKNYQKLAEEYKVGKKVIENVVRGYSYKHIK